jgi:hypothetical protein
MLKIYLKCNNCNIDLHCHTNFWKKGGSETFCIFEAPGMNFWHFLKQIGKQIACKFTVFYKNGYHFTKNNYFIMQILPENV